MKENKIKKDVNELSDENLESASGGVSRFNRIQPNIRRIGNNPDDVLPLSVKLERIVKNKRNSPN